VVLALGALPAEAGTLGGSEFLVLKNPVAPWVARQSSIWRWRRGCSTWCWGLRAQHMLASAHDVSEGGLAVALAECCVTSPQTQQGKEDVGARITLPMFQLHLRKVPS